MHGLAGLCNSKFYCMSRDIDFDQLHYCICIRHMTISIMLQNAYNKTQTKMMTKWPWNANRKTIFTRKSWQTLFSRFTLQNHTKSSKLVAEYNSKYRFYNSNNYNQFTLSILTLRRLISSIIIILIKITWNQKYLILQRWHSAGETTVLWPITKGKWRYFCWTKHTINHAINPKQ